MCGIIGYKGPRKASELLLEGLKRLQYRGYDSVGMAVDNDKSLIVKKDIGEVEVVDKKLNFRSLEGVRGIAHTRWSTHGKVVQENAHPHLSNNGEIAVVHNGIIENYQEIKKFLLEKGFKFKSQTDSEVVPNLIEYYSRTIKNTLLALRTTLLKLRGSYAFVILIKGDKNLYFARDGSPLVVGIGKRAEDEIFIASDVPAFLEQTNKVIHLDDGEYGFYDNKLHIYDIKENKKKLKSIETVSWTTDEAKKGKYPHFMLKEIYEQQETIRKAIEQPKEIINTVTKTIKEAFGVFFVGCGTSYHACVSAAYQFSHIAHKHINVVLASEFRNYKEFLTDNTLVIALSQSGETADLLDAVKTAKRKNSRIIAITNVMGSTLQRLSDISIMMHTGPEISVVSTKSYTSQLAILLLLAYATAGKQEEGRQLILKAAKNIRTLINKMTPHIKKLAKETKKAKDYYLIGRDLAYPSALEGALKLKETAYVHAEGFAGGELKHGTIALVEKGIPVIVLSTKETEELILSNAEEIKTRGGYIIGINSKNNSVYDNFIEIPNAEQANPLLMIIPIQLLAYYLAVQKGCNIDKPRNLAKCVTVK